MRYRSVLVAAGIALLGVAGAAVGSQPSREGSARVSAGAPTVGEFVVRYAATAKLALPTAPPETALAALRSAGWAGTADLDLSAPLTEGAVIGLGKNSGLGLTSRTPGKSMSRDQMETFFSVFGNSIESGGASGADQASRVNAVPGANGDEPSPPANRPPTAADPRSKGNGKKTGLSPHFPF